MPDSRECVNIRTEDGRMCASISGDIDHHSAREMRLRIDTAFAVSDARELILDMSGVKFMDSSGLGRAGSVVRRDKSERVGEARA